MSVLLSIHPSIHPSFRLFKVGLRWQQVQQGNPDIPLSSNPCQGFRLRCADSSQSLHSWLPTALVHAEHHSLMEPSEPHYLQKAERRFWDSHIGPSLPPSCTLRSCTWKSQTEEVTSDNEEVCHWRQSNMAQSIHISSTLATDKLLKTTWETSARDMGAASPGDRHQRPSDHSFE